MAQRQAEFLERGARVFGLSADSPGQNAAVMEKLALPFPILSDVERDQAVTPLGFADENDPRQISRPGVVIISPDGEIVSRFVGKDYADRPDEGLVLEELGSLGLDPTSQVADEFGPVEPGEKAASYKGLKTYLTGAKFATLAWRGRYRHISDEFKDDTKAYVAMVERYLEALSAVDERKA
jgi:AhpC/TSA family